MFDPLKEYSRGLRGCFSDPRSDEVFADSVIRHGGDPDGDAVAHHWGFADLGKGKLTATWMHVEEQFPGCWPGPPQAVGDCFVAGTMVTMADGSLKSIESVAEGDFVRSPFGRSRRVTSTFKKAYEGRLWSVTTKSRLTHVVCTPDHLFLSPVNQHECQWVRADEMDGRRALSPFGRPDEPEEVVYDLCDFGFSSNPNDSAVGLKSEARRLTCPPDRVRAKGSSGDCPRHIALDEDFAWFVGLFLAEGSCDTNKGTPRRITLNLSSERRDLAERAAAIMDRLGIESKICSVPSKPTVLYLRVSSIPFATLIYRITGSGNTYTKHVPRDVFRCSDSVREALVCGWFAGDGWFGELPSEGSVAVRLRAVGVSVNRRMISEIQRLSTSVGIHTSMAARKAYKRSKAAYQLDASGENARRLSEGRWSSDAVAGKEKVGRVDLGFSLAASAVESDYFSGDVYCIEVEEDHAFIANGLAVHNCVSHGCKNACLTTLACELSEGKPDEVTGLVEGKPDVPAEGIKQGVLSTEAIYWWRRDMMGPRSMDGWVCSDAAKHVTTNAGLWLRKPYEQFGFDLTKYSANNIRVFLGRNPPDNVRDYGRQYLIRTATNVRGREQVRDFLAAGYGVFFCSSLGWSSTRNEDGVSYTQGSWAHSQAAISFDERPETVRKYGEPLVGILNSWGRWNRGPRKVLGTDLQIPEGAYWTPASVLDRCSCIALSSVAGWPPRKLKSYGAKGRI